MSNDERYQWLNYVVCVGTGEVRSMANGIEIVLDMAKLIWEPLSFSTEQG